VVVVEDIVIMAEPVPPAVSPTLVVLRVALRPVGETVSTSFTVPANPSRLANDMVVLLEVPAVRVREVGLAEMVKSVTVTGIVREWLIEPLVVVTVTV